MRKPTINKTEEGSVERQGKRRSDQTTPQKRSRE